VLLLAALQLLRPLLTRALAARVASALELEVAAPQLQLAPGSRELLLRADVTASRAGALLRAPGTRLAFPLSALLSAAAPRRAELAGAELSLSPELWGEAAAGLPPLLLREVAGRILPGAAGSGVEIDLSGQLAGGGGLAVRGQISPDRQPLALWLELSEAEIGALRPHLHGMEELSGRASGPCRVEIPGEGAATLSCQLELSGARLRAGDLQVDGALRIELELARGPAGDAALRPVSGHFQVDASAARLSLAGLTRPAGQPATIRGRILPEPDGPRLEYQLHFERFQLGPRGE
jgi:hypothetical protein